MTLPKFWGQTNIWVPRASLLHYKGKSILNNCGKNILIGKYWLLLDRTGQKSQKQKNGHSQGPHLTLCWHNQVTSHPKNVFVIYYSDYRVWLNNQKTFLSACYLWMCPNIPTQVCSYQGGTAAEHGINSVQRRAAPAFGHGGTSTERSTLYGFIVPAASVINSNAPQPTQRQECHRKGQDLTILTLNSQYATCQDLSPITRGNKPGNHKILLEIPHKYPFSWTFLGPWGVKTFIPIEQLKKGAERGWVLCQVYASRPTHPCSSLPVHSATLLYLSVQTREQISKCFANHIKRCWLQLSQLVSLPIPNDLPGNYLQVPLKTTATYCPSTAFSLHLKECQPQDPELKHMLWQSNQNRPVIPTTGTSSAHIKSQPGQSFHDLNLKLLQVCSQTNTQSMQMLRASLRFPARLLL